MNIKTNLFFGIMICICCNSFAATCILSGTYSNTSSFQSVVNGCGANDTIVLTGTAQWSGAISLGAGQTLQISSTATMNGGATLTTSNPIIVDVGATFNTNGEDLIINGVTYNNLGSVSGPTIIPTITPLPVQLVDWKATITHGNDIILTWTTASETNNRGFQIERSDDGSSFESIGWVDGHNNSKEILNYNFTDKNVFSNTCYYRLLQLDYDDNMEYSKIISVDRIYEGDFKVNVYPTMTDKSIHVLTSKSVDYYITNIYGSLVSFGSIGELEGEIDLNKMNLGRYFIQFVSLEGDSKTISFYKLN